MARLPKALLVPVDGSPGAGEAAKFAVALAIPLGAPVRLLFAFPRDALDMLGLPSENVAEVELETYSPEHFAELRERQAARVFARARAVIGEAPARLEEVVLAGDPASAILSYADGVDDPMIIMGSRGLSRFSEMLMGSVSHRVLHHARCPVTIVHR